MADSVNRRAILRRRMAFLGGALAALPGCDKAAPPPPHPTPVPVGDPEPTVVAPTPVPSDEPATPGKLPPHPSTEIPATTCAEDREELMRLKALYEGVYRETEALYAELPGCALTEDACVPKHQPLAQRCAAIEEQLSRAFGLCGCPAPIVNEYGSQHGSAARQRLELIRERIVAVAGAAAAGERWDELVREEATPRPCLSCVMCEPKSACD